MSATNTQPFSGAVATDTGMSYNGVDFLPVIDKCEGCDRTREFESQKYCSSYPAPAQKWRLGRCNFATHVREQTKGQAKVNPLKASKRASRGK